MASLDIRIIVSSSGKRIAFISFKPGKLHNSFSPHFQFRYFFSLRNHGLSLLGNEVTKQSENRTFAKSLLEKG